MSVGVDVYNFGQRSSVQSMSLIGVHELYGRVHGLVTILLDVVYSSYLMVTSTTYASRYGPNLLCNYNIQCMVASQFSTSILYVI